MKRLVITEDDVGDVSIGYYELNDKVWHKKDLSFTELHNLFLRSKRKHRETDPKFKPRRIKHG